MNDDDDGVRGQKPTEVIVDELVNAPPPPEPTERELEHQAWLLGADELPMNSPDDQVAAEQRTPAEVTVTLPWDEAQALADHPATLQPDDPGLFWVAKVKRACGRLTAAMRAAQGAHLEARGERLPDWPAEELPEALKLARRARVAPVPLQVASPSKLYRLAVEEHGTGDEATKLYRHAMIEAGYMVPKGPGYQTQVGFEPCDPCPICNWSPTK